ncbi:MAG: electron transfer flavoprotein subunit alpha/FixB family protein [Deltaproteobacteria bacterium]|nr:electron transfer flavoprotein subunit alpha/FixB family protein [Deltaproteobacteria bacterium]
MGNILILAEHTDGKLRAATLSAVSFARKLKEAKGGAELHGLVIGAGASVADEFAKYVDKVSTVESAELASYQAETWSGAAKQVFEQAGADVLCAAATSTAKDLLPRVAALLGCGMVSEVATVEGPKTFKRPMLAGNAIGTVEVLSDKMVATVRQSEWAAAEPSGTGTVAAADGGAMNALGASVERVETVKNERPDLTEASVVIAGGRGMKAAENFAHLEKLADIFGGAMGATRAACDAGMVPNDLQVGQTGKVVAPDLYIAIGISGAIQHLAGMKGSKVIVAINKDPEAPIFSVADYGLVAKWEDTLPELTEKIQVIKSR